MDYDITEIAAAVGGKIIKGTARVNGITKDSKNVKKGDLFIALKGARFDAHDFAPDAAKAGAAAILAQRETEADVPHIIVENTHDALGAFAAYHCKQFPELLKVAVTGSAGKTTTKDMTASVLAAHFGSKGVLKTQGNFNNDIGLPFTVLGIEKEHKAAVIEMGMNHFGEIDYLTNIVHPDMAIITNIGTAHMENLGSREGILKAKCEIFNGMKKDAVKILNGDNDLLSTVKAEGVIFYSTAEKGGDIYATDITPRGLAGTDLTINTPNGSFKAFIPLPGEHSVSNALAAAAAGYCAGASFDEIAKGLADFVPTAGRLDIYKSGKYTVIDGTYNANPDSMKAAIDVLKRAEGFRCAILGDMLELGARSAELHGSVGEAAKDLDLVVAIGTLSEAIYEKSGKNALYFSDVDKFTDKLKTQNMIPEGAYVLIKASHSMHFEKITKVIEEI